MTDSLKLAEMQRTNIEFERQRHLANWLIKSSPHMATPPPTATTSSSAQSPHQHTTAAAAATTKAQTAESKQKQHSKQQQHHSHNKAASTAQQQQQQLNQQTSLLTTNAATTTTNGATTTSAITPNSINNGIAAAGHSSTVTNQISSATTTTNSTAVVAAHQQHHQQQHLHSQHQQQHQQQQQQQHYSTKHTNSGAANNSTTTVTAATTSSNPVFYLMASNGNTSALGGSASAAVVLDAAGGSINSNSKLIAAAPSTHLHHRPHHGSGTSSGGGGGGTHHGLHHLAEGRKAKLRRFNSHDTSSNMFSVADFENARLARRNEIELKQRLARRMRNGGCFVGSGQIGVGCLQSAQHSGLSGCSTAAGAVGAGTGSGLSLALGGCDYSTGDSKASKNSNESQTEPLAVDEFIERYSLPRVVRISYKTKFSQETLESSSSNNSSSTVTTTSTSSSHSATAVCTIAGTNDSACSSANQLHTNSNTNTTTSASSTASSSGGGGGGAGGGVGIAATTASQTLDSNSSSNHSGPKSITTNGANDTNHNHNNSNQQQQQQQQHHHHNHHPSNSVDDDQGELFLLYRLVRQRHIYHGHNAKSTAANRKKGVLIPQEFPGYFSLLNDKGLPTATMYTSLVQLVRERVCKFVSVDNMPAFMESQPANGNSPSSPTNEGCLNIYSSTSNNSSNRPQYVKTTAKGGQVFKLLAVYEDGKQEHNALATTMTCGGLVTKQGNNHGREKEKSRYAQLLNEQRQTLYVSLATKGKFYEIEPGIPQILQKRLDMSADGCASAQRKINPDCVHRITALLTPQRELPMTLRYVSGPNGCASAIPENLSINRITTENIIIACPIEDVEMQTPLHLRKLHLTKEMNLVKNTLGFESEQRMLANPNVQNILKFCQFNCDQFLKMVEIEILQRSERSSSKSRGEGLKILKPLHFPKLLRREKTTIPAHEKEDSIIFLSKTDLQNLESKEVQQQQQQQFDHQANRITEKMKVFQSTKKKWFRKQDKQAAHQNSLISLDFEDQAKRMSMERYSDMSKLLQERFGDKPAVDEEETEPITEISVAISENGCSDTETTTLATIEENLKKFGSSKLQLSSKSNDTESTTLQKSMSLQDIEYIGRHHGNKPDLLASHHRADTISEAGTDFEDIENVEPPQTSFITEKLYNEFHVKTKQYSKSSSSLHQLLNFSLPQKLQIGETKRSLHQLKSQHGSKLMEKRLDFNIGEPVTGRRANGGLSLLNYNTQQQQLHQQASTSLISPMTPSSIYIEDDLPYSSVRDSLVLSSDGECSPPDVPAGTIRQALHLLDYGKENIYAEICHEATAMGGIPSAQIRETQLNDDGGDYASLSFPAVAAASTTAAALNQQASSQVLGNAISRVQITCSARPVSYHTVYFNDEPLGDKYNGEKAAKKSNYHQQAARQSKDRAHITTVDVAAAGGYSSELQMATQRSSDNTNVSRGLVTMAHSESGGLDNIYNTLK